MSLNHFKAFPRRGVTALKFQFVCSFFWKDLIFGLQSGYSGLQKRDQVNNDVIYFNTVCKLEIGEIVFVIFI